jgi:preprotein translocase subunit SecD
MMRTWAIAMVFAAFGVSGSMPVWADDAPAKVEIRRAETKAAEGLTEATIVGSENKIYLHKEAELSGADIASVGVTTDKDGAPAVEMTLTKEGAKKLEKVSADHKDKPLAILVDGKVIFAPVVRATLGDKVVISGKFTKADAEKLARKIKAD